jgi:hypothetical protein
MSLAHVIVDAFTDTPRSALSPPRSGVFRGTVVACFQRRVAAGGAAPPPGLGDLGGRPSFAGPGGQQHRHLATAPHGRRP